MTCRERATRARMSTWRGFSAGPYVRWTVWEVDETKAQRHAGFDIMRADQCNLVNYNAYYSRLLLIPMKHAPRWCVGHDQQANNVITVAQRPTIEKFRYPCGCKCGTTACTRVHTYRVFYINNHSLALSCVKQMFRQNRAWSMISEFCKIYGYGPPINCVHAKREYFRSTGVHGETRLVGLTEFLAKHERTRKFRLKLSELCVQVNQKSCKF